MIITQYTKKELAQAIKTARKNNCPITVFYNHNYACHTVKISKLPVGCGLGTVTISFPKSHRTADKIRLIPGVKWQGSNYHYTRFYYDIPNTAEALEQAKKHGAKPVKGSDKVFMGSANKNIEVTYMINYKPYKGE